MVTQKDNNKESRIENFVQAEEHIEKAISENYRLKQKANEICEEIREKFCDEAKHEFEALFVTMQQIRPELGIIETIGESIKSGELISREWLDLARHYLEPARELQDIQASIGRSCRIEMIAGWDKDNRFDVWLYNEYEHEKYFRIFAPLLVIHDKRRGVERVRDWTENLDGFQLIEVTRHRDPEKPDWQMEVEVLLPDKAECIVNVIGTIEIGYLKGKSPIELSDEWPKIEEFLKPRFQFLSKKALEIRKARLEYLLDVIVRESQRVVRASGAHLHFIKGVKENRYFHRINKDGSIFLEEMELEPNQIPWIYQTVAGEGIDLKFLSRISSSSSMNEVSNYREGHIIDIPSCYSKDEDALFTPSRSLGTKSILQYPILIKNVYTDASEHINSKTAPLMQGCLCVHFGNESELDERTEGLLKIFVRRAIDAITQCITNEFARDRTRQLETLQNISQSLATVFNKEKLLERVAWSMLNLLAADSVIIYELYERSVKPEFTKAGRFLGSSELGNSDLRKALTGFIKNPNNKIGEGLDCWSELDTEVLEIFCASFFEDQKVKSSGAIFLKVGGGETVGIMYINYRRPHRFSNAEKRVIETLASSSAIAISQQRWLETLNEIDRRCLASTDNIVSQEPETDTLPKQRVLNYILEQAKRITGADVADIRLIDKSVGATEEVKELVLEACYPKNMKQLFSRYSVEKGITGYVARRKAPYFLGTREEDQLFIDHYEPCYDEITMNSELCVPLLSQGEVIGVLNLESENRKAFNDNHRQMLEILASRTVIALQIMEDRQRSLARNSVIIAGWLTQDLIHIIEGHCVGIDDDAGTIKRTASMIENDSQRQNDINCWADNIKEAAKNLRQEKQSFVQFLNDDGSVKFELFDIREIITQTVDDVRLEKDRIKCELNYSEELPEIYGIRVFFRKALRNLMTNAKESIKGNGANGKIKIDIRSHGNLLQIDLIDNGQGIPLSKRDVIFQQGYTSKSIDKHNRGFGLWHSRTWIKHMRGELQLIASKERTAEEEGYAHFRITVPVMARFEE